MLWGLLFFLVVGVILFDIVTGIIIDKFSELRERTLHRFRTLRDVGFISDIGRSEYEERGPEFKFDKLQAREEAARRARRPPRVPSSSPWMEHASSWETTVGVGGGRIVVEGRIGLATVPFGAFRKTVAARRTVPAVGSGRGRALFCSRRSWSGVVARVSS